jgi:cobalt-zinc-cadmium efflux system membrane fusion protein
MNKLSDEAAVKHERTTVLTNTKSSRLRLSAYVKLKLALAAAQLRRQQLAARSTEGNAAHITLSDDQTARVDTGALNPQVSKETVETAELPRPWSNLTGWIVAAAALILTFITALLFLHHKSSVTSAAETTATSDASSVAASTIVLTPEQQAIIAVEVVQRRPIELDVAAPGKIAFNGNRISPVYSQFSGRLVRLNAEVGTTVRAGQVIGMIDTPDIVAMQADYQQAVTAERSARTSLELATRTRERSERLAAAEAIPQRDLQQAQADAAHAADDLQRAQSAVAAARSRLQSAGASADEISHLTAGLRAVNHLVPLVAPISGTITERKAGLGQVVQAGAGDPLFMIADLSSVWVNADIYEDQLASVHNAASVKIQTPAYPNETFMARVDQIGSVIDPDKHTVAVRCVVPNPAGRLKPGMFATVILNSAAQENAIMLPASAIVTEGDHRYVFVEESMGHYVKREIVAEIGKDGAVIVKSGLHSGERVVTRGAILLSAQEEG